jgi:hypothetical protein
MNVKTSFFDVANEVQKDLQDVSAGIGNFQKNLCNKFSSNLMSKLVQLTWTSPSTIWVNNLSQVCTVYKTSSRTPRAAKL